jgi:hypothetical protein
MAQQFYCFRIRLNKWPEKNSLGRKIYMAQFLRPASLIRLTPL